VRELETFLGAVLPETVTVGSSGQPDITLNVDEGLAQTLVIEHGPAGTAITGRTPTALLHAVYRFLEHLGYVFSVRGPIPPDGLAAWPKAFRLAETPVLEERGIRQHINFPMDVSGYSLPEAVEYVRNLARLKFNFITFHCYHSCGWYHFSWQGFSDGEDPNTTLYYSEQHAVCREPLVRAQSPNLRVFCIPELEAVYRQPAQRAVMQDWLGRLIACAQECGLTVCVSLDPTSPGRDEAIRAAGLTPSPDLYTDLTVAAARAILAQYPTIDVLEILTVENTDVWPAPKTLAQAWGQLASSVNLPVGKLPQAEHDQQAARALMGAAGDLQVSVRAIQELRTDPALAGKRLSAGIYCTNRWIWPLLGRYADALIPVDVEFTCLAGHSSVPVARHLTDALPPRLLRRTRIYAWCEFDGEMYLQQNEVSGLAQCLALARTAGVPSPVAIVANHWRTAENEVAINYLAAASYAGLSPEDFYAQWSTALMGPAAAEEYSAACQAIDQWSAYAVDHIFNMGFCYLGCWLLAPRMGWANWQKEHVLACRDGFLATAERLDALLPLVARPVGLERCRFMSNRLRASAHHCDVIVHLIEMRRLVQAHDPGHLPEVDKGAFLAHGRAARAAADRYVRLTAAMMPDRGSEGTLTSYTHVIHGFIERSLGAYLGGEVAPVQAAAVDGPPPPEVVGQT